MTKRGKKKRKEERKESKDRKERERKSLIGGKKERGVCVGVCVRCVQEVLS